MTLPQPSLPLAPNPVIVELPPDYRLVRFYNPAHGLWDGHRFFGPIGDARFDHHPPPAAVHPDRSVWYAGSSLRGALAEAFGRLGLIDRAADRRIVQARVAGSIEVLDLLGTAARRVRLTQEIAATTDYRLCQSWARAFYDDYRGIAGIRWRGREIGSINVVLNDRVEMGALSAELDVEIGHPSVWPRIARAARECSLEII